MQSVNFYFDEYRPKPLSFDSRFAVVVLSLALVMLVIIGSVKSYHQNQQKTLLANKQTQLNKLEQEVLQLRQKMNQSKVVESIDAQITRQQNSLNSYRKILTNLQIPEALQPVAYSQVLLQLGEQTTTSLWLTKISMDAQILSLQGSSLKSEAIPQYIDLLKNADALKRQFDELKVERDPDNSQLVNFSLNNGRLSNDQ